VWQRPQHLIARMAASRPTWFVEEPLATGVRSSRLGQERRDGISRVWLEVSGDADRLGFDDPAARLSDLLCVRPGLLVS
jgi:hypothetical protein